ncbi:low molecular weight phosphotyrosine protein phosphatase [Collimonas pratensis]|uniref:protein-tyrosine-phosphatase n=1 Tax=Collimonas pratensis TaxID=279113 RepID=A0A127Q8K4_9BURK|nr:low molecular weight protein-tyrosine-phosphatase [Collimonas pratensis]AMP06368.1 low molecular weight protein-tyrosine-phosphatase ptp [Collimonas pratensis]NKI70580.1 low molecular weight phosphotyrosine protein phosphatase [Collimonas pratensis]
MMNNLLVICIGNICRSPMAQGLLHKAFPDKTIRSAGIDALVGYPADPHSIQIMQEQGIDISGHRAQRLTDRMVREADLILTMDTEQKRYIEKNYPAAKGKVLRSGEFGDFDIPDPYQQDMSSFRQTYRLISQGMAELARKIVQIG